MVAGKYKHRLTLQRNHATTDDTVETGDDWQDVTLLFCEVKAKPGSESEEGGGMRSSTPVEIRCRWGGLLNEATSRDRLLWKDRNRVFHIASIVNVDEQNREALIHATESDA